MKKIFITLLIAVLYEIVFSQAWYSDFPLTTNTAPSSTSQNNAWCIASNGNNLHVAWYDERDGNWEIYYKHSTNEGTNWSIDSRLTINTAMSLLPSIAVSGLFVHVVWQDTRDGNSEIYYKGSSDGGFSWGGDLRLTNNSGNSEYPSMAVSVQDVHVVWQDNRDGNYEIYYKKGGIIWGTDTRLTNNSSESNYPSIAVSNQNVHIVWQDNRDGNYEIYYKRSTDGGLNWGADTRLTSNPDISEYTCIAVSNQNVYVVWDDSRDSDWELYIKRSIDNGITWSVDTRLTNSVGNTAVPNISAYSQNVGIVWHDERDGNHEIYYKYSTNGGANWQQDYRLTNNVATSIYPSISISNLSIPHVIWKDFRDGNYEIYYKRGCCPVGIKNISSEIPNSFNLGQDYPNPFNPTTNIKFDIPKQSDVKLIIYDALGRKITTLINEELKPGTYKVDWDATNYTSGVYFYSLTAGEFSKSRKMVIIK